jgi:hypothetical protein
LNLGYNNRILAYTTGIMKKTMVIETLSSFDDEFDAEALIERLLFIEKVEKGLNDVNEDRVIDFKDAKQKFFNKWEK